MGKGKRSRSKTPKKKNRSKSKEKVRSRSKERKQSKSKDRERKKPETGGGRSTGWGVASQPKMGNTDDFLRDMYNNPKTSATPQSRSLIYFFSCLGINHSTVSLDANSDAIYICIIFTYVGAWYESNNFKNVK